MFVFPFLMLLLLLLLLSQGVVHATFFTSCSFEKVFGNCGSSLGLFENKEMVTFFKNLEVDAAAEATGYR